MIYKEGSGCYGLNGADTASIDAVLMSKAVGAPVRVQWMRGDEHVWEHYGTPMIMKVKGGLDADGNLIAWDYESLQAARGGRPGNVGAANLPTGALIGLTLAPRRAQAPTFPPLGADNSNTEAGYLKDEEGLVPNARVIAKTVDSAFFTGPLRSPARIQNSFANESFIDELAAAAGVDPVTFRLRYVGDERLRHVIEVAAKAAGWQLRNSPKPASKGDIATGSRHLGDAVRGRGRLRGDGRRGRGEQAHRQGARHSRRRLARRRDHHQPARDQGPDRGERRPRCLPRAQGGGRARRQDLEEPRLGELPGAPLHRAPGGQDRADQPAERGPDRLGRERDDGDPGGGSRTRSSTRPVPASAGCRSRRRA